MIRIETVTRNTATDAVRIEERYLISSLRPGALTPAKWQKLVRLRWGVETTHQVLDTVFQEDDHPWIEQNPCGMLVVALLRRLVYTLLALFRQVTQRSDERRNVPWKTLLEDVYLTLVRATDSTLEGLRQRPLALPG